MEPPLKVLVNSFTGNIRQNRIDLISKIFILSGIPLGVIRLPLFANLKFTFILLSLLYSSGVLVYCGRFYMAISHIFPLNIHLGAGMFQFIFYLLFDFGSVKRLEQYYIELNVFDNEVKCTPKISKDTFRNMVMGITIVVCYIILNYVLPLYIDGIVTLSVEFIPLLGAYTLEQLYCSHLISLLIPRLRLINYYMELSLPLESITRTTKAEEFGFMIGSSDKSLCKMRKLMHLYYNAIRAFNCLMQAIKWQLAVSIVTTFISTLFNCYKVFMYLTRNLATERYAASSIGFTILVLLPLFAPCILAEQVHDKVRRLRELLAVRLYEDQLDKDGRDVARALLAWTQTKDFSFSLLRMIRVDISLPFKFVGLLITYLIILLQFQKVLNP